MANIYKDEAGHFTSKENDGGPCRHKRISNGKYEKSEDGGKTWTPFNSRKEYDEYDGESWEFDSDDEEESSPMNEFSGPDKEGPNFAQLESNKQDQYRASDSEWLVDENGREYKVDKAGKRTYKPDATTYNGAEVIGGDDDVEGILKDETPLTEEESKKLNKSDTEEYKPFEGKHNYLVNRMYNSDYDTPEDVLKDAEDWDLSDKEKWGLDEEIKQVFGVSDEELKDIKNKMNKKESDNLEWRLKPENLAIVQKLQKMGINTGSMSEEDFDIAREFLKRFGK